MTWSPGGAAVAAAEGPLGDARSWRERHIVVDGVRLRVGEMGSGPPLLLVTGIGANVDMWTPFASIVDGRRLIAFDAPGTGGSAIGRPRRMRGLADLAAALLDELGLEQADVLGYSFGGALAQELARRHPERVRRLVLVATACGLGAVPPQPEVYWHMVHPLRFYSRRYLSFAAPRIYGGRARHAPLGAPGQAQQRFHAPPSLVGYGLQLMAISGWTSLPWLHTLSQPTLILSGDDDPIIRLSNARLLRWRIPDARLHVVPGGGHLFLIEEPESAIGVLQDFLDAPM